MNRTDDMNRIVVGVDGSEHGEHALRWALAEARLRRCGVHAVLAYDLPTLSNLAPGLTAGVPVQLLVDQARGTLDAAVDAVVDSSAAVEPSVTRECVHGHAADVLISSAKGAQMLVLGTHGRGGFLGMHLGSVTTHCVHHAPCPVVVVPPP